MTIQTQVITDLYVVYDCQTGQIVSKPMSFQAAIRSVDKRDLAYGAYRYGKKRVE
jgi:hypothetical protein